MTMASQAQLERNMKIAEIRKIARKKLNENLPKKQYDVLNEEITKAKGLVAAFKKYKPMLKAEKKIMKWSFYNTNEYNLVCMHGDSDNVWLCYRENNLYNLSGELIDNDNNDGDERNPTGPRFAIDNSRLVGYGCSKHDNSVVCIDDFCAATDGIDEFSELVKCLSYCATADAQHRRSCNMEHCP
jgi:hypothetical protein